MAYGALLTNAKGSTIISSGETSYLYWGKVSSIGAPPDNPKAPVYLDLFQIPLGINVKIFVHSKVPRQRVLLSTSQGTVWQVAHYSTTQFGRDADIYVFVDAKSVPIDPYGMAVYNESGVATFHTARPPLQVTDLQVVTEAIGWTNSVNYKTVAYKAAVSPYLFEIEKASGVRFFDIYYNFAAAGNISSISSPPAGGSFIGGDFWILDNVGAPINSKRGNTFTLAAINAGNYDLFPNKGNWV